MEPLDKKIMHSNFGKNPGKLSDLYFIGKTHSNHTCLETEEQFRLRQKNA